MSVEFPVTDQRIAYSVAEVCSALGIARATLYSLWASGAGPPKFKLGKRTLVSRASLLSFVASLEAPTAIQPTENKK
jgi:predicted DNA-binding transcriptional regulator AlpA